jgi:hypothetical protein
MLDLEYDLLSLLTTSLLRARGCYILNASSCPLAFDPDQRRLVIAVPIRPEVRGRMLLRLLLAPQSAPGCLPLSYEIHIWDRHSDGSLAVETIAIDESDFGPLEPESHEC